jgi:hypothetical protein
MKTKSLFTGAAWMALAVLAAAALTGCATHPSAVDAQLHPARFLENASGPAGETGTLEESQAAVAASWRR